MARFDSGVRYDSPDLFYDDDEDPPGPDSPQPARPFALNQTTSMEYWEITLDRAQKTLPVWQTYVPTQKIRGLGPDDLDELIDGFQPLVQARVEAQDVSDAAFRAVQAVLLNVTAVGPAGAGYRSVYPTGTARPNTSVVNHVKGQTVANSVVAKVGGGERSTCTARPGPMSSSTCRATLPPTPTAAWR